ncbi:MAG: SPL family radical SAM protein [Candidatus Asgardarchaeia archaeon]
MFEGKSFDSRQNMVIKEIMVKSVLSRSGIYSIDFSINPYLGCQHGCVYCYARVMKRHAKTTKKWGQFVFAKVNAPTVLAKEIKKVNGGSILLSSVCDPYQPIEKEYEITRNILEVLLKRDIFEVHILTKSNLVLRDIDLIKKFKNIDVGFSIAHIDERIREIFEPNAAPVENRIKALNKLSEEGIKTYLFIAPVLPEITEKYLNSLLDIAMKAKVEYVFFDTLNLKAGNQKTIYEALQRLKPLISIRFRKKLLKTRNEFYSKFKEIAILECKKRKLDCTFAF